MRVMNEAGEAMTSAGSDSEAARWYLENGRAGDYLEDTGEWLSDVVFYVFGVRVVFDHSGCVSHGVDQVGRVFTYEDAS